MKWIETEAGEYVNFDNMIALCVNKFASIYCVMGSDVTGEEILIRSFDEELDAQEFLQMLIHDGYRVK